MTEDSFAAFCQVDRDASIVWVRFSRMPLETRQAFRKWLELWTDGAPPCHESNLLAVWNAPDDWRVAVQYDYSHSAPVQNGKEL